MSDPTWTERVNRTEADSAHDIAREMAAKCDRLEALLREARDVIVWHDEQDVGICMLEANDDLVARIKEELGDA